MGKSIRETMQEFTVNQALNYLEGNPEENIPKLMAFVDRFMPKDWYTSQRNAIRKSIEEKNNWYQLILRLYELDPGVQFYILGISPNAARLSVRFFLQDSFGVFLQRIQEHQQRLEIVKPI